MGVKLDNALSYLEKFVGPIEKIVVEEDDKKLRIKIFGEVEFGVLKKFLEILLEDSYASLEVMYMDVKVSVEYDEEEKTPFIVLKIPR